MFSILFLPFSFLRATKVISSISSASSFISTFCLCNKSFFATYIDSLLI